MSDKRTTLIWTLRDEVSATARKVNGQLNDMGIKAKSTTGILGKLGAATGGLLSPTNLLAGGIFGLSAGLLDAAKAGIEEEKGIDRLNASLKANVTNWDGNTKAVEDQVTAMEDWSAFSDDQVRKSLAALVPATHTVKGGFDDMRVAMDLARFKDISLEDATARVVKVLAGNNRALKDLGISLPATASATEKLAAIEQVAAGQAEAYAKSHAGSWDKILNKLNDVKEVVGDVVVNIADGIAKLGEPMDTTRNHFGNASKGIQSDLKATTAGFDYAAEHWRGDVKRVTAAVGDMNDGLSDTRTLLGVDAAMWFALRNPDRGKMPNPGRTGGAKPHASGGWVGIGGPELAIVGEKGPEYITPANQIRNDNGDSVRLVGVSKAQLAAMIDREFYFKLSRSSPSAALK